MTKIGKTVLLLLGLALCLADTTVVAQPASQNGAATASKVVEKNDNRENEIREVLIKLTAAANDGDAVKTASLWSEDAVFIDEGGEESCGRAALKDRLAATLKERGSATIEVHPEKMRFPAPNVAAVICSVSRKHGNVDLPATRLSMIMQKQDGSWQIAQATETRMAALKAADYLKELEWLIGNWQIESPNKPAKLEVDWGSGRNFIVTRTISNRDGVQQVYTQVIGWDPRSSGIVSWHFGPSGGFGYGKWTKNSDGWLVDFAGVAANGSITRATNVFSIKSPDEFLWQSAHQTCDGAAIADSETFRIKKVQP